MAIHVRGKHLFVLFDTFMLKKLPNDHAEIHNYDTRLLSQIDPDATAIFYGYATAANKAGHVVFAFIFAIWAHKISGIK